MNNKTAMKSGIMNYEEPINVMQQIMIAQGSLERCMQYMNSSKDLNGSEATALMEKVTEIRELIKACNKAISN